MYPEARPPSRELDHFLVASTSSALLSAGIPCVLWGNYLLTVYGVPTIVNSAQFVVPDSDLSTVRAVLKTSADLALDACPDPGSCNMSAKNRPSPGPAVHFHVTASLTVGLYRHSETLWRIPSLVVAAPANVGPAANLIAASDPRLPRQRPGRGYGAFSASLQPVFVPSALRLTEALVFLLVASRGHRHEYFWMAMLTYIMEYVDGDGLLDESLLEPRCRLFFQHLKEGKLSTEALLDEFEAGGE